MNTRQSDEPFCAGAIKELVKLVGRGSESASAAGAAHALAVFTTGKNASTYRASVQTAGGVPALLTCAPPTHLLRCLSLAKLLLLLLPSFLLHVYVGLHLWVAL